MKSLVKFLIVRNDKVNEEERGYKYRSSLEEMITAEVDDYEEFLRHRPFEHTVEIKEPDTKRTLAKIVNGKVEFKEVLK